MPVPTTPGEAIAQRLLANGSITALVNQRVYPSKPEGNPTWPFIVYFRAGGGGGHHLGGRNRTQEYTMRVEVYAEHDTQAQPIIAAVVSALKNWRDIPNKVHGSFATDDADEVVLDDGSQVPGQSFRLFFQEV